MRRVVSRWTAAALIGMASACAQANTIAPELREFMPAATLAGSTRFSFWGLPIYDASLWVAPGFDAEDYDRHAFTLELRYLRDFTNQAIAGRSIEEMRRQSNAPSTRVQTWQQWLRSAFPDVKSGDRIAGVHRPGEGIVFLTNGKQTGAVRDAEFARLFFGIWLSNSTSEPALRKALLAGVAARP